MARPRHQPTDETRRQIEEMSAYGIPQDDIAKIVGLAPKTLRQYYRYELDTASARKNMSVARLLFRQCESGNVTAQIFWLKTRAKWTTKDEDPTEIPDHSLDLSQLTDEELDQLERLTEKALPQGITYEGQYEETEE